LDANVDLIGAAFNAALVNRFNKNGDGIDTNTAIAFKNYFINKPTNIEHKKQRVVGHIVNSAFSTICSNEIISENIIVNEQLGVSLKSAQKAFKTIGKDLASFTKIQGKQLETLLTMSDDTFAKELTSAMNKDLKNTKANQANGFKMLASKELSKIRAIRDITRKQAALLAKFPNAVPPKTLTVKQIDNIIAKVKNANDSGKTCSDAEMSEAENRGEESEIKIIETRLTEKQHVSENPGNDRSCCCGDICFVCENTRTMAITVRCSVCHFYCHEECSVSNPSGEDSGDEAYMQIMCDLCSKKTKCSAV
jgi:hypothetical protein